MSVLAKCLLAKCLFAKCLLAKCLFAKRLLTKCRLTKYLWSRQLALLAHNRPGWKDLQGQTLDPL